jgi:threonine/homoserine/homoserine lactone efflux protein
MEDTRMTNYGLFLLAFAASAAAPGPEIAALLGRSLSGGMRSSLPLAVGIVAGKLLMLTAAVAGLSALVTLLGPMFAALKYGGAAYLLWLGVKKWRNAGRALADSSETRPAGFRLEAGLGLAMTLSNPIAIMFYLALLPGVVDIAAIDLRQYAVLCLIVAVVMAAVTIAYGLLAEAARRMFSASNAKTHADRASGTMMMAAGVLIASR